MVRKPAHMYRNISKKAYTRRKYMGGFLTIASFSWGIL